MEMLMNEYGILAGVMVYLSFRRAGFDVGEVHFTTEHSIGAELETKESSGLLPKQNGADNLENGHYGSL